MKKEKLDLESAIKLLRNAVKESNIKNQKHIDLTVIDAKEKLTYQHALVITQKAIEAGEIQEDEFKQKVGLIGTD